MNEVTPEEFSAAFNRAQQVTFPRKIEQAYMVKLGFF
jgi:hypothetical protein